MGDRLTGGHFMALHGGHLYIGLVNRSTMKTPGGCSPGNVSLSLKEVVRRTVNLMERWALFY